MTTQRKRGSLIEVSVDDQWRPPVPSNDPGAAFGVPLKPSERSSAGSAKSGAPAEVRKEALEVKLQSVNAARAPEVGSPREARKEALEVKLKPAKERGSPKGRIDNVVREALTVKLRSARRSSENSEKPVPRRSYAHRESERKEGLLQLERLRHVNSVCCLPSSSPDFPSTFSTLPPLPRASHDLARTQPRAHPRPIDSLQGGTQSRRGSRRGSATPSLRKMASSLLTAGGVLKPSTLFGGDRERHTSREDFTQLVAGAHEQLKSALAAQEAELERLAEEEAQQCAAAAPSPPPPSPPRRRTHQQRRRHHPRGCSCSNGGAGGGGTDRAPTRLQRTLPPARPPPLACPVSLST